MQGSRSEQGPERAGLRRLWDAGQAAVNGWCLIGNPFVAEIMAAQGFDSLTVDLQHGALDYSDLLLMLQAMRAGGATLLARVPWLDPSQVMKALDAGAEGIICPMVNTAEEAARFVSYLRYPPLGCRSFGPVRAGLLQGDYAATANDRVVALAMIETVDGFANLEAILDTPGLTGVYVGPADLSLALGQGRLAPGMDREEPEMQAAFHRIVAACQARGLVAGLHCGTAEYAARAIGWGFRLVTVGSDMRFLTEGATQALAGLKAARGGQATY
jgi:4-hydroxy-2-oxoheptanedioate aldolase